MTDWAPWKRRLLAYGPLTLAVAVLAQRAISRVLDRVGHPAATLDDSYIHFQYARAIAEGHPLRFQAGEPFTSGATSVLWPALLAPFYALGLSRRGHPLAGVGAVVRGAGRARVGGREARPSSSPGARPAVGAGAMVVAFSGFAWCAASGMEVVPFAWVIARTVAPGASELAEDEPLARTPRHAWELVALAWAAALFRPEGAAHRALRRRSTLALFPRRPTLARSRARACAAGAALLATPVLLLVLTGSARSNTAVVKLLPGNPYYVGPVLRAAVEANLRTLLGKLLDGEVWSAEFLPKGGAPLADGGARARWRCSGHASARQWRALGVLLDRADDVRAVLLLHVPLEPPALPLALRDGVARRPRVPRARRGRPRRQGARRDGAS